MINHKMHNICLVGNFIFVLKLLYSKAIEVHYYGP